MSHTIPAMTNKIDHISFRLWRWNCDQGADGKRRITLEVGMRQGRYIVVIPESGFDADSTGALRNFNTFYHAFLSKPWKPGYTKTDNSKRATVNSVCFDDCVVWIIAPLHAQLNRLGQARIQEPRQDMTLTAFWRLRWRTFHVRASADVLIAQEQLPAKVAETVPFWTGHPLPQRSSQRMKSAPSSRILIPGEPAEFVLHDQNRVVRVGMDLYDFKNFEGLDGGDAQATIRNFQAVKDSHDPNDWVGDQPGFLLSLPYAKATFTTDQTERTLGVLLPHMPNLITLRDALQQPMATKEKKQVWKDTLRKVDVALRGMNISWDCAGLDTIMVDPESGRIHIREYGHPNWRFGVEFLQPQDRFRSALAVLFRDPLLN